MEKIVEALKGDAFEWQNMSQLLAENGLDDLAEHCTDRAKIMDLRAENLGKLLNSS